MTVYGAPAWAVSPRTADRHAFSLLPAARAAGMSPLDACAGLTKSHELNRERLEI
jgi:hypothetical protein